MVLKCSYPIVNDEILDFDAIERLIHYLYHNNLGIDANNRGLIFIEPPCISNSQREKLCQIFFETLNIPAILLIDAAVADAASIGKKLGLVVRFTSNITYIVPVSDAIPFRRFVKKILLGYSDVTEQLRKYLLKSGYSFMTSREKLIVEDIREKLSYIALNPSSEICEKTYKLPDGEVLQLKNEIFMAPEMYFKPKSVGKEGKTKPIDIEIYDTLMNLDEDVKAELAKNIILSGNLTTGMKPRLQKELEKLASFPIEIIETPKFSSWLGCSIIGTLKHIAYPSEYWITSKDYFEYGPEILHSKHAVFLK